MSVAERVIARVMGIAIPMRFDAAQARGLTATIELRLRPLARRPAVALSLAIADGRCDVHRGPAQEANAALAVGLADGVRLALRRAHWPQLVSSGRLVLTGDPFLALRVPSLFGLTPPRP